MSVLTDDGELLIPHIEQLEDKLVRGKVQFVSVGMFFPYVMYLTPVLNGYLQQLSGLHYIGVRHHEHFVN